MKHNIKFILGAAMLFGAMASFGSSLDGDVLTIDDDAYTPPAAGITVSKIVGKATSSGVNSFAINAGGVITVKSDGTICTERGDNGAVVLTVKCPLRFGEGEKSAVITLAPDSGSKVRIEGATSGKEAISVNTSDQVEMASDESTYEGDIYATKGTVVAENENPLGTGNFYIDFTDSASKKVIFTNCTVNCDVRITGKNWANTVIAANAVNIFNGDIYVDNHMGDSQIYWNFQSGSTNYLNGRVIAQVGHCQHIMGSANNLSVQPEIHWNGGGTNLDIWYFQGGKNYVTNTIFCNNSNLKARGEVAYSTPFYPSANKRTEYFLQCEKPFMLNNGTAYLSPAIEDNRDVMYTADGANPIFASIYPGKSATSNGGNAWTPINGYLHFNSTTTNKFRFVSTKATQNWFGFAVGNVSMAFEGANSTIYVGGTNSTSTGTLSAENSGTVIQLVKDYAVSSDISATARWAGDLMVTNGGKIVINDNANFKNCKTITIADANSKIYVTNGVGIVAKLVLDGMAQTGFGTWGGSECAVEHDHFDARILGEGVITNAPTYTISETSKEIPAEGLTVGELIFSGACNLTGGPITIVNGGSIVSHGAVTIRCPLVMGCSDRKSAPISIRKITPSGASANSSVVIYGTISGNEDIELWDNGDIWFCGDNTFDGNLTVMQGAFYVNHDHALGSINGWTKCDCAQPLKPMMWFMGVTMAEPFFLRDPWAKRIVVKNTNVFNGLITLIGTTVENCWTGNNNYNWNEWNFQANSKTYFNGGMTRDGTASFEGYGDPTAEIYWNSNFDIGRVMYMNGGTNIVNCHFTQSGGQAPSWRVRGSTWVMNVEDAVKCTELAMENGERVTYILNADQSFTQFFQAKAAYAKNYNIDFNSISAHVVKLTAANVTIDGGNKWFGKAYGSASLALLGANSEILIGGASTSSGTLTISNGYTVVMAPTTDYPSDTAKWSGAIKIYAGSKLTVNSVDNFNKKTTTLWFYGDDSKIEIPAGVTITVDRVFVDGVWQIGETYDKSSLSGHITGDGTLKVRRHGNLIIWE